MKLYSLSLQNRNLIKEQTYLSRDKDIYTGGGTKKYFTSVFNTLWMQFDDLFIFFLGNGNIFALTNQKLYSARFDMKDVEQKRRYALYDKLWIDDENNKYSLHISDYSGDASNVKDWVFYFFRIFNFFFL